MQVGGGPVDLVAMYTLALIVNLCGFLWAAGIATRLRTIQAGPLMQMPVFLLLFLAPVYVPLALLGDTLHAIARFNPLTYALESGRGFLAGDPVHVALGFGAADARRGAAHRLGAARAALRRSGRLGEGRGHVPWLGCRDATLARRPFPLGPTWDGDGTNFSLTSENAERVELCLFDEEDVETRHRAAAGHRPQLARLPAGCRPRPALRLPRARAVGARAGPPLQREQAADRPVREGDRGPRPVGPRHARSATPTATTSSWTTTDDAAGDPEVGRDRPVLRLGGRRAAPAAVGRDRHLRAAREGLHAADARRAGGPAGDVRGARHRTRRSSTSSTSASPPSSCSRSTTSPTSTSSRREG